MPRLWDMLTDEGCIKLIQYQAENYPDEPLFVRVHQDPPVVIETVTEPLNEIDRIMRQPPGPQWRVEP
uniref:Uncharacterized protein n=1 Tax=viral metagenome TaxID=1070528 RepID=A0A6H1ZV54_9ZZZZ